MKKNPQYKRKGKTRAEILKENPDAFKKKSNDPYYLKVGKFIKKAHYDLKVDMGDAMKNYFINFGKETITDDQYINIGFNNALLRGLDTIKISKKK